MTMKKENTKCFQCKKKVLVPMSCMCSQQFCIQCRTPELHKCTFDYFKHSKQQLEKNNPLVIPKKVDKI
jgi:hypothetical protein